MNKGNLKREMSGKEQAFWGRYAEKLFKNRIEGHNAEWHMRRAQGFVYGLNGLKLNDVSSAYLDSYLAELGRNPKLEAWQVRQAINSLRVLFVEMTKLEWPSAYDWEGRLSACLDLAPAHPTLAREIPLDTPSRETSERGALDTETLAQIERIKEVVRVRGMSIRTEQTYVDWAKRFAGYCGGCFPGDGLKVRDYLEYLALVRKVAPATQAQALNALVFVYGQVLEVELGDLGNYRRPARKRRLPVVLSRTETNLLLKEMQSHYALMASLLYGAGMRLMECVRLRIQDLDLNRAAPYFLWKLSALRFGDRAAF